MVTKDYCRSNNPRALLIGHDPRLRNSNTIAEYALFADYHFPGHQKNAGCKSKERFADLAFQQLRDLSGGEFFSDEEVYVTNLCNEELPNHPPKKGTVYIPREKAKDGVKHIEQILLDYPSIRFVFPMSQQVNYWLQELGFYSSSDIEFKENATPKSKGVENRPQYYEPKKGKAFLKICGKVYQPNDPELAKRVHIIPILHCRCYPLGKRFEAYEPCYEKVREWFKGINNLTF